MDKREIEATIQFERDFMGLPEGTLLRPNISLSERLDSGDEPFERVNGVVDGLFTETVISNDNGE